MALFGIIGISPANADGKSYLQKLKDAGISTRGGDYEVKEWGYEVCALRAQGKPPTRWVEQAVYQSALHPPYGLTEQQANTIVDLAVSELCDDRDGPPPYEPLP
ncbi:DUF732 domain-containing protein [Mycobacterium branderi]|nr:DUF732 domain-containing protein [Mycobacterium branderi]MCV7232950.1 DUF732 domain-containing protein [Mycobacterium branderi]ORA41067.1 hypothetical protein BST20_02705 [Mycobacterium branderi]